MKRFRLPRCIHVPLCAAAALAIGCGQGVRGGEAPRSSVGPAATDAVDGARPVPGLRAAWIAALSRDADARFALTPAAAGASALHGHNAPQSFQMTFSDAGLQLSASGERAKAGLPSAGLRLSQIDCGRASWSLAAVPPQGHGNRVEYAHRQQAVTEWYANGPLGIEQGFTFSRPSLCPEGQGQTLRLQIAVAGPLEAELVETGADASADSEIILRDRSGAIVLHYSDLYVYDQRGATLPARLSAAGQTLTIEVDQTDAVYPITVDPLIWFEKSRLMASDAKGSDLFGSAIAISGSTALIGAYQANMPSVGAAGAVYVFERSGSTWTQTQKLTASDATNNARFGSSVAIDRDTALVGAPSADSSRVWYPGAGYVFERASGTWTEKQKLLASDASRDALFGYSVALQGDIAVLGSPRGDVGALADAGAGYVFARASGVWTEEKKLTASDAARNDQLGLAVALDGDTTVLGAANASVSGSSAAGAAYVYVRASGMWSEQKKLTASDASSSDTFGMSLALSSDTLVVGAGGADTGTSASAGAVYLFRRASGVWSELQKVFATDAIANSLFGALVAFDGKHLLVGAPYDNGGGTLSRSGAAYVYGESGGSWTEQKKLVSSTPAAGEWLGSAVAISGDFMLVGAQQASHSSMTAAGLAYVFGLAQKDLGDPCSASSDCASTYCVDGVCCDSACSGGITDCQACSVRAGGTKDGACLPAGTALRCRAATTDCDADDYCDGMARTCPADGYAPSTKACRTADYRSCDATEYCTGTSPTCPADGVKAATEICRPPSSGCDAVEYCDGTSKVCPNDLILPAGTVCRPSAGSCDIVERCNGWSSYCPTDDVLAPGVMCRGVRGECDVPESCDGRSGVCPADVVKLADTLCRPASGVCDVPDSCDGVSPSCGPDAVKPEGSACRVGSCHDGRCREEADLRLSMSADPPNAAAGQAVRLTLSVENAGLGSPSMVQVQLSLPAGSHSPDPALPGWLCIPAESSLTCTRQGLSPALAVPLLLAVQVPGSRNQEVISAAVSSALHDPDPLNNTASITLAPGGTPGSGGQGNSRESSGCSYVAAGPPARHASASLWALCVALSTALLQRRRRPRHGLPLHRRDGQ